MYEDLKHITMRLGGGSTGLFQPDSIGNAVLHWNFVSNDAESMVVVDDWRMT